eukprot:5073428-Prymnesium_polylepis.1
MSYPAGSAAKLVYCFEPCIPMRQWEYPRLSDKKGGASDIWVTSAATHAAGNIPERAVDPHLEQVGLDPKRRLVRVVLELLPIAGELFREIGQRLAAHNLRVFLVGKVVLVLELVQ